MSGQRDEGSTVDDVVTMRMIDARTGLETLDEPECLLMLEHTSLGRLAVIVEDRPAIFPINFCRDGSTVVFRTDTGTKLDALVRSNAVAFEVDGADPLFHTGWSVVLSGRAEEITEIDELERVRQLPLQPWGRGGGSRYVRIRPDEIGGRRIVRLTETLGGSSRDGPPSGQG